MTLYEKILSVTPDDHGISYYFRGKVEDNYVNFAGMCWKIVRIAGDGSIKLILEDQYTTCDDDETFTGNWNLGNVNFGYDDSIGKERIKYLEPTSNASTSMVKKAYDFQMMLQTKISEIYSGKLLNDFLKSGEWCLADKAYSSKDSNSTPLTEVDILEKYNTPSPFYYDTYVRLEGQTLKEPTLKCNGTTLNNFKNVLDEQTIITTEKPMYVGGLTADEVAYAGGSTDYNVKYYLINNYQIDTWVDFRLLSPTEFKVYAVNDTLTSTYLVIGDGNIIPAIVSGERGFRPSIVLKSNITATTNPDITNGLPGTIGNPYVIN